MDDAIDWGSCVEATAGGVCWVCCWLLLVFCCVAIVLTKVVSCPRACVKLFIDSSTRSSMVMREFSMEVSRVVLASCRRFC